MGSTIKANNIQAINDAGDVTNFFDANGFMGIRYRDEYVSGEWVYGSGGAAPDIVTFTILGVPIRFVAFDGGNTIESMSNSFEIPHDISLDQVNNQTLTIEQHIHGLASTNNSGSVIFNITPVYFPPKNLPPISMTPFNIQIDILPNQQYYHKIEGFDINIPVGGFNIGGIIAFVLLRNPTGDTYPDDFLFFKTALHIPTDGDGSRQRYIK